MATCKDCFHYEICLPQTTLNEGFPEVEWCKHFKNKADVVCMSKETIIGTKNKWLVINVESKDLGKAIKSCLDYLTKNARSGNNG